MPVQLTWNGNHSPLWKRRLTMPLLIFLHETGRTSAQSVYFTSASSWKRMWRSILNIFTGCVHIKDLECRLRVKLSGISQINKEKSILDFPTKSVQNTLTVSFPVAARGMSYALPQAQIVILRNILLSFPVCRWHILSCCCHMHIRNLLSANW